MSSDRRQFGRVYTALPVRFWPARHGELPAYQQGQTVDLSAGGLLCRCDSLDQEFLDELSNEEYAIGLLIRLPGGRRVRASGRIVWMGDLGGEFFLRVCFTSFRENGEDVIDKFLASSVVPDI